MSITAVSGADAATVYFDNGTLGYDEDNLKIHYWNRANTSESTTWPGVSVTEYDEAHGLWKCDVPDYPGGTGFLINSGSRQTGDLLAVDGHVYGEAGDVGALDSWLANGRRPEIKLRYGKTSQTMAEVVMAVDAETGIYSATVNLEKGMLFNFSKGYLIKPAGPIYYSGKANDTTDAYIGSTYSSTQTSTGACYVWSDGDGTVTITLRCHGTKKDECPFDITLTGNGPIATNSVQIMTSMDDYAPLPTITAGDGIYNYTFKGMGGGVDFYFSHPDANGNYRHTFHPAINGFAATFNNPIGFTNSGNSETVHPEFADNTWKIITEPGVEYTICVDLSNWEHRTVTVKRAKISVPALTVTPRQFPAVYLLSEVINFGRISPEYEMIPGEDGIYRLSSFPMRNTTCRNSLFQMEEFPVYVIIYDTPEAEGRVVKWNNGEPYTVNPNISNIQPGWEYNATFNIETEEITFSPAKGSIVASRLPYLGIVGANFRQERSYPTPNASNTDEGWQESYIQYGPDGEPLLDSNGRVMYNTMWPPKNNIFFNSVIGDKSISLSSDNLTFSPYIPHSEDVDDTGSMTGAQWKKYLSEISKADGYADEDNPYRNLSVDGSDDATKTLVDNVRYRRFVVNNMWMLGAFKIWTGWSGAWRRESAPVATNAQAVAQWGNHMSVGYLCGVTELENGDKATPNNHPHTIASQTAYTLNPDGHDFLFEDATYFATVEFFIPYSEDARANGSVLYTTEMFGGAEIQARDLTGHRGAYLPQLSYMPEGYMVKGYRIVRCDATVNLKSPHKADWQPVGINHNNVATEKAVVYEYSGEPILTAEAFNEIYPDFTPDNILGDGRYFYYLEVDFTDTAGSGTVRSAVVPSNPLVIRRSEAETALEVFQLVSEKGTDRYVTFKADAADPSKAEEGAPIYTLTDASSVTPATVTDPAYGDGSSYIWTDRVLLSAPLPDDYLALEAESKTVKSLTFHGNNGLTDTAIEGASDGNRYFAVYEDADLSDDNVLYATMEYEYIPVGGTSLQQGVSTFRMTNWQPTLPSYAAGKFSNLSVENSLTSDSDVALHPETMEITTPSMATDIRLSADLTLDAPNMECSTQATVSFSGIGSGEVETDAGNITIGLNAIPPKDEIFLQAATSFPEGNPVYNRWNNPDAALLFNLAAPESVDYDRCVWYSYRDNENGKTVVTHAAWLYSIDVVPGNSTVALADEPQNVKSLVPAAENSHFIFGADGNDDSDENLTAMKSSLLNYDNLFDAELTLEEKYVGEWYNGIDSEFKGSGEYSVKVAHAYLFDSATTLTLPDTPAEAAAKHGKARAADVSATHTVLAGPYAYKEIHIKDQQMTALENITDGDTVVIGGNGHITSTGNVAVYTPGGILVAYGSGRHSLPQGIYIVDCGENTVKVTVR